MTASTDMIREDAIKILKYIATNNSYPVDVGYGLTINDAVSAQYDTAQKVTINNPSELAQWFLKQIKEA